MTITEQMTHMADGEFWFFLAFAIFLSGLCFYLAFNYLKKSRLIEDTPTAKIRSAASTGPVFAIASDRAKVFA